MSDTADTLTHYCVIDCRTGWPYLRNVTKDDARSFIDVHGDCAICIWNEPTLTWIFIEKATRPTNE